MFSQMIQGNYPNYEQLIPTSYTSKVSFSTPLMLQRLSMIDKDIISGGIVRFVFKKYGKTLEHLCKVTASSEDEASFSLSLPVKIETEEDSKIAFNLKYMQDALKPFSLTTLELTSPSQPGKFTGDIEGLTIVVMPMYVQWD